MNVEGTRNAAELSRRYEAFLVYVSTDYVFKEDKGMYRETEEANPVNYYGLTKLEGERRVIDILDGYCIVRSSVIYGSRPASGKVNFALWIIERLRRDEAVNVLRDQWNSPTLNTNLAEMILEIAERKL
ncbi:MAG: sugar nucleotide-binding protein, partial [Crenarchaeota archaeon]|nr:sugar nucleotide-binding protein [Thermoproteota archaeon]